MVQNRRSGYAGISHKTAGVESLITAKVAYGGYVHNYSMTLPVSNNIPGHCRRGGLLSKNGAFQRSFLRVYR